MKSLALAYFPPDMDRARFSEVIRDQQPLLVGAWLRGIVRNKWRENCGKQFREVALGDPEMARLEEAVRVRRASNGEQGLVERLADCRAKLPEALSLAMHATAAASRLRLV